MSLKYFIENEFIIEYHPSSCYTSREIDYSAELGRFLIEDFSSSNFVEFNDALAKNNLAESMEDSSSKTIINYAEVLTTEYSDYLMEDLNIEHLEEDELEKRVLYFSKRLDFYTKQLNDKKTRKINVN
ncbi:16387_t:CDS:1 [Funneliformis caledonium]|uniref:16387_t:CDS:1 n=1 Tax=Funneliformis caledonium TaxID=1117310 RepID=A0A9N9GFS8_9GLOM|nr:16387_t:CDS:1 [Funneliformis caledonium]